MEKTMAFFCDKEIKVGQVVELVKERDLFEIQNNIIKVVPGQNNSTVIGISLNNIVPMTVFNHKNYNINWKLPGSRITILQEGTIRLKSKKQLEIGTKLYYNKKGNLTTKKQNNQNPIGYITNIDNNNYVDIRINIWGVNK